MSASCESSASTGSANAGQFGEVAVLREATLPPARAVLQRHVVLVGVALDDVGRRVGRRKAQRVPVLRRSVLEGSGVGDDRVDLRVEGDVGGQRAERGQVCGPENADRRRRAQPASTAAPNPPDCRRVRSRSPDEADEVSEVGVRSWAPSKSSPSAADRLKPIGCTQGFRPDRQAGRPRCRRAPPTFSGEVTSDDRVEQFESSTRNGACSAWNEETSN